MLESHGAGTLFILLQQIIDWNFPRAISHGQWKGAGQRVLGNGEESEATGPHLGVFPSLVLGNNQLSFLKPGLGTLVQLCLTFLSSGLFPESSRFWHV